MGTGVEFECSLKAGYREFKFPLPSVDRTRPTVNFVVVGGAALRDGEFFERPVVVEESMLVVDTESETKFSEVRVQCHRAVECCSGHLQPLGAPVAAKPVYLGMCPS